MMTIDIDTAPLARAIPRIVAFGRRTMQEQCVTSSVMICRRAQALTPAASIGRIDAMMSKTVNRGRNSKHPMTLGELLVLQRTHPNSPYNRRTGGRWALTAPKFSNYDRAYGHGSGRAEMMRWLEEKAGQMRSAMHSATHLLKAGWIPAIKKGKASEFYRYSAAGMARHSDDRGSGLLANPTADLGDMVIDVGGDSIKVTASNDVGEPTGGSNPTLGALHRKYLVTLGIPAANQAIAEEAASINAVVEQRLAEGMKVKFHELLN